MRRLFALFALLAVALVVAPGAAADDTPCMGTALVPGTLPPGTYDNIVVPPGQVCVLTGVTVRGNVKALENSRLRINNSNVRGNVLGEKADTVEVIGGRVRENIIIKEGGPAPAPAPSGFFPSCFAIGDPCEALVRSVSVEEGGIQIEKMVGAVLVDFNAVLNLSTLSLDPLRGNVQVKENVAADPVAASAGEAVWVRGNNVAQNVQVEDNFVEMVAGPPFFFNGLFVSENRVGENLQVYKNRGPGTKVVSGNTVSESLQCFDNDPPFVGFPNVAREAQGQCMAAPLP